MTLNEVKGLMLLDGVPYREARRMHMWGHLSLRFKIYKPNMDVDQIGRGTHSGIWESNNDIRPGVTIHYSSIQEGYDIFMGRFNDPRRIQN